MTQIVQDTQLSHLDKTHLGSATMLRDIND